MIIENIFFSELENDLYVSVPQKIDKDIEELCHIIL